MLETLFGSLPRLDPINGVAILLPITYIFRSSGRIVSYYAMWVILWS
ncbi:Hypothetical protein CFV354_0981 [Campylobacter fetus subsp. venerealis NCTC 10354]|nr:Hypothetical protein CFV354_0981 [Campylobacter fetus subsp. venerealis NCTC 10354]